MTRLNVGQAMDAADMVAKRTPKQTRLDEALSHTEAGMGRVEKQMVILAERLSPLLSPNGDEAMATAAGAPEKQAGNTVLRVRSQGCRMHMLAENLAEILNRLDV